MFDQGSSRLRTESAYLSVGANLGDREASVLRAVGILGGVEGLRVGRVSSLYETDPEGCPWQPRFINATLEVRSLLCPLDLLKRIKAIEKLMGRKGSHNEPREIDIDIVAMGKIIMRTDTLTIPHPRYAERAFVLVPLWEIAPYFKCPLSGKSIDEMIESLPRKSAPTLASGRRFVIV